MLQPQEYKSSWDRAFTIYRWYTCQEDGNTVLYANFHGANPNEENVEINVRGSASCLPRPAWATSL